MGWAKAPGALPGLTGASIQPLLEEGLRQLGHPRVEPGIGVEHQGLGLVPGDLAVVVLGQGGVAVPDLELGQAEPARLERVVAVREPGVGGDHRVAQRLHHLGLDVVRQVPAHLRGGELAPAVLDLLLLGERVGDAGKEGQARLEHHRQRPGGGLAPAAVAVGEQVQRGLEAQRLAGDVEFQPRQGLVEQPVPGGGADHGLVVQEPLELVRELVGLHLADAVQHRPIAGEPGAGGEQRLEMGVLEPVELEREEDQRRGQVGDARLASRRRIWPGCGSRVFW